MQVILLQEIPTLGHVGDVKTVADGYARNYLIPRGLAKPATAGQLKQAAQHRRRAVRQAAHNLETAQAMAERLSEMTLVFEARAGEGTKLYGSITSSDIAERIAQDLGQEFDRRKVLLGESLRQLGTHRVPIRLMADVVPEITVVIEREGGEPEGEVEQAEAQQAGDQETEADETE